MPTEEDLLVLYLDGEIDAAVVRRLAGAGGTQVAARNPYDRCRHRSPPATGTHTASGHATSPAPPGCPTPAPTTRNAESMTNTSGWPPAVPARA
jgi:hypothetical protein